MTLHIQISPQNAKILFLLEFSGLCWHALDKAGEHKKPNFLRLDWQKIKRRDCKKVKKKRKKH